MNQHPGTLIKTARHHSVMAILALHQLELSTPTGSPLHKEVVEVLNAFQRDEGLFENIRWPLVLQGRA